MRDYGSLPNVETTQMFRTMVARGVIVGLTGAVLYLTVRSALNDLMEEVRAGLT